MLLVESTSAAAEGVSDTPSISVRHPEECEDERPRWKGKGKAIMPNIDAGPMSNGLADSQAIVDWAQYDPPEGLKDLADCKSEIVIQVIQESIDRVKARIVEEAERRDAEEEVKKLRQEERLRQENEDAKYAETLNSSFDEILSERDGLLDAPAEVRSSERPAKSKKRRLMNLLRRLNNIGDKGESSATGATLHKRNVSWSSIEQGTQAAKKLIVTEVLKRTTTNSSSSPNTSVHDTEVECVSCLDDFSPKEMVKVPCHSYCKDCFLRLISTTCENEQQWPPKCCLNPIPKKTIILNVDDELKETYHNRAAEWNIAVSERIYCSHSNCSIWIRPYEVNRAENTARCSAGHWSCIICRGPRHEGVECPQDRDMMRTDELAEEEGWKRCYGCHAYVEHREACQHMTCRCGAEFCYVCGLRWRTCDCSMEQLAAVKRGAEERRQTRLDREALEEAEIQEALRLVEEFEREEALKAELLRQEQERIAQERREKLLEERIRREGKRRQDVGVKFQGLREVFANIHDLQRINVQLSHKEKQADLESQGAAELIEFQESRKEKHEKLIATTNAKLSKKEDALKREYAARVISERHIEEQYEAELKAYWSRKRDSEGRAEAAIKEWKRKMAEGFSNWEKWRDSELENYRWIVKENQGIQEEFMDVEEQRLVENTRDKQNQFSRRKAAELRWVDIVVEERDRMLNDMEIDEIENGENVDAWFEDGGPDDLSMDDIDISQEIPQEISQEIPQETPQEILQSFPVPGLSPNPIVSKSDHA
ncbi:hypothetical protein F4781DRAFT_427272 [Annulohypoxylon bovei var. microspora]|nr:hypothetical protein F4781DRAFT_427272 [Annulohypoxylon bovei var. microspora]